MVLRGWGAHSLTRRPEPPAPSRPNPCPASSALARFGMGLLESAAQSGEEAAARVRADRAAGPGGRDKASAAGGGPAEPAAAPPVTESG